MAKILIVDDDPNVLKVAGKVLQKANYEVSVAKDALSALELLGSEQFDALISDANMPHFSGFELVKSVKSNPRYERMAIAMLTGLCGQKDIHKAVQVGVDEYIIKPIDPLLFIRKVEGLFRKKPPENRMQVTVKPGHPISDAFIQIKGKVHSVSEQGLVLRTEQELANGSVVQIQTLLFRDLEVDPPLMRALTIRDVSAINKKLWEIQFRFVDVDEKFEKKIREWIGLQSTRHVM